GYRSAAGFIDDLDVLRGIALVGNLLDEGLLRLSRPETQKRPSGRFLGLALDQPVPASSRACPLPQVR
ncbi:hypothetical protein, partial [Pseudomonas sp. P14-2025]|uniref:hypothetical protein n=1 Tax=Pseudomonas sp. P14-2025 TaxID=3421169 RepID=UPI003FA3BAD0